MAPLRRYLRITPYSILEVRIYLDNPADLHRWLIHPQRPVLPDVLAAVKPLVLPKLKEENARAAGKKTGTGSTGGATTKLKGKKGVRDVITTDAFEVSIFLTELSTPHAVLVRSREFSAKDMPDGVTGTKDAPMMVRDEDDDDADVRFIRRESNSSNADQDVKLEDLPLAEDSDETRPNLLLRGDTNDDALSVSSHGDVRPESPEPSKKKLQLRTSYDGFSIYGRILCLVVKRKNQRATVTSSMTSQQPNKASTAAPTALSIQGHIQIVNSAEPAESTSNQQPEGLLEAWMRSSQIDHEKD